MVSSAPIPPLHPLLQQHREAILRLARRHGVERVRVFGSFARGDARADSDVDFLIDAGVETPAWFPGGLVADLQEMLGRRVDVAEPSSLHPRCVIGSSPRRSRCERGTAQERSRIPRAHP